MRICSSGTSSITEGRSWPSTFLTVKEHNKSQSIQNHCSASQIHSQALSASPSPNSDLKTIKNQVIILGQLHWAPIAENDATVFEQVFNSQKTIMEYIILNNIKEVFEETEIRTSRPEDILNEVRGYRAITLFPDGLPADLHSCTYEQKKFIAECGAAYTLLCFGIIKIHYRSISLERERELSQEVKVAIRKEYSEDEIRKGNYNHYSRPALRSLNYDAREGELLKEIQLQLPQIKDEKIVIIFGRAHFLEKYFNPANVTYLNMFCGREGFVAELNSRQMRMEQLNKRLLAQPMDLNSRLQRAEILFGDHKYERALEDLEIFLPLNPHHQRAQAITIEARAHIQDKKRLYPQL